MIVCDWPAAVMKVYCKNRSCGISRKKIDLGRCSEAGLLWVAQRA
jgi:hypothetical protein